MKDKNFIISIIMLVAAMCMIIFVPHVKTNITYWLITVLLLLCSVFFFGRLSYKNHLKKLKKL